jgi:hypothetical protein
MTTNATTKRTSKATSPKSKTATGRTADKRSAAQAQKRGYRKAFGKQHKALRHAAGKTQQMMSAELGLDYYTMISQIEAGNARIPTARLHAWAKVLGLPASTLAVRILMSIEPELCDVIFGDVWVAWVDFQNYLPD